MHIGPAIALRLAEGVGEARIGWRPGAIYRRQAQSAEHGKGGGEQQGKSGEAKHGKKFPVSSCQFPVKQEKCSTLLVSEKRSARARIGTHVIAAVIRAGFFLETRN
jgi:hypothetical protein